MACPAIGGTSKSRSQQDINLAYAIRSAMRVEITGYHLLDRQAVAAGPAHEPQGVQKDPPLSRPAALRELAIRALVRQPGVQERSVKALAQEHRRGRIAGGW
jgi:hypothetical protein